MSKPEDGVGLRSRYHLNQLTRRQASIWISGSVFPHRSTCALAPGSSMKRSEVATFDVVKHVAGRTGLAVLDMVRRRVLHEGGTSPESLSASTKVPPSPTAPFAMQHHDRWR